ncbi:hypothetical protein KP509_37G052600 [Ceratopteris richardii]|uniref:Uncharacterized protein n=1 Tax=Ceratopteris richardii TaxID=49495 RepID=A0A8T2Q904_CERRI|nr:hypothetical protein KP509_37G052600 [Ceratopteris richardii]
MVGVGGWSMWYIGGGLSTSSKNAAQVVVVCLSSIMWSWAILMREASSSCSYGRLYPSIWDHPLCAAACLSLSPMPLGGGSEPYAFGRWVCLMWTSWLKELINIPLGTHPCMMCGL